MTLEDVLRAPLPDRIDEESFKAAADAAKDGCPVSGALKGNVELTLDARLATE